MQQFDPACVLTTRSNFVVTVRPACAADEAALAEFFKHVAHDDLRFRFLSGQRTVSHDQLGAMLRNDRQTENFLAFSTEGLLVATAMLACDAELIRGEVAIAIHADYKGRGVGWELLEHVARYAKVAGIKTLESVESRENHAAIELERELGFSVTSCPGDATLVVVRRQLLPKVTASAI